MKTRDSRTQADKSLKRQRKNPRRGVSARRRLRENSPESVGEKEIFNHEHQRIEEWLETVKFRKVLLGGVDERQLWRKLEELNGLYEAAIRAERARYDALLEAGVRPEKAADAKEEERS